ncbi:MAG: hypothetical protein VE97_C0007G0011, partial [candidate division Kazan bacterium GW2011_GWB1_45_10]
FGRDVLVEGLLVAPTQFSDSLVQHLAN